jgi:hypothetical protein
MTPQRRAASGEGGEGGEEEEEGEEGEEGEGEEGEEGEEEELLVKAALKTRRSLGRRRSLKAW